MDKMITKQNVEDFVSQKKIAVVGVSRSKGKFGNIIYSELKKKQYTVYGVNPNLEQIDGDKCYEKLNVLENKIDALVCVVPSKETELVVREAKEIGIKHIWMQQGSESDSAIEYCEQNNINVIYKECLLMFLEPTKSIHGFHKWLWKILGKLPK
jgi:hypothetical protein